MTNAVDRFMVGGSKNTCQTQSYTYHRKTAGKWWKCDPICIDSGARNMGWPWTWWIGFAPVQMSGCCLGAALSWFAWWAACRGWLFFSDPSFLVNSYFDHSRAWIPACSRTAAPLEGYWCCRTWVQWRLCIGGAKCGLIASNEREVQSFLGLQRLLARSLPRRRSRRACVCSCIHFVCVCVYMCMCVCMRTYIYVYVCMCVCICTSMRLCTCVRVCVCMFVHRLWALVSVLQRVDGVMHVHVFSCAYACVCIRV